MQIEILYSDHLNDFPYKINCITKYFVLSILAGYFAPTNIWTGAATMASDTDVGDDPPPCGGILQFYVLRGTQNGPR